jgi:hypothetical protein
MAQLNALPYRMKLQMANYLAASLRRTLGFPNQPPTLTGSSQTTGDDSDSSSQKGKNSNKKADTKAKKLVNVFKGTKEYRVFMKDQTVVKELQKKLPNKGDKLPTTHPAIAKLEVSKIAYFQLRNAHKDKSNDKSKKQIPAGKPADAATAAQTGPAVKPNASTINSTTPSIAEDEKED